MSSKGNPERLKQEAVIYRARSIDFESKAKSAKEPSLKAEHQAHAKGCSSIYHHKMSEYHKVRAEQAAKVDPKQAQAEKFKSFKHDIKHHDKACQFYTKAKEANYNQKANFAKEAKHHKEQFEAKTKHLRQQSPRSENERQQQTSKKVAEASKTTKQAVQATYSKSSQQAQMFENHPNQSKNKSR